MLVPNMAVRNGVVSSSCAPAPVSVRLTMLAGETPARSGWSLPSRVATPTAAYSSCR
nr:hypothetical protein [Micromonospora sp. NBRC 101691]